MCENVERVARVLVNDWQPVDLVLHKHLHGIIETAGDEGGGGKEGGQGRKEKRKERVVMLK